MKKKKHKKYFGVKPNFVQTQFQDVLRCRAKTLLLKWHYYLLSLIIQGMWLNLHHNCTVKSSINYLNQTIFLKNKIRNLKYFFSFTRTKQTYFCKKPFWMVTWSICKTPIYLCVPDHRLHRGISSVACSRVPDSSVTAW